MLFGLKIYFWLNPTTCLSRPETNCHYIKTGGQQSGVKNQSAAEQVHLQLELELLAVNNLLPVQAVQLPVPSQVFGQHIEAVLCLVAVFVGSKSSTSEVLPDQQNFWSFAPTTSEHKKSTA